jgi:hypothetical protein
MASASSDHHFVDHPWAGEFPTLSPSSPFIALDSAVWRANRTFQFQILIGVVLFLKGSNAGFVAILLWIIPTLIFDMWVRERFMRPYHDAALLQTSRLDGWQDANSLREREEFRQWLVDCHKASYVPICLSGGKGSLLTCEPAVVISREEDLDVMEGEGERLSRLRRQSTQRGAIFARKFF